jgi:hypothetical protein
MNSGSRRPVRRRADRWVPHPIRIRINHDGTIETEEGELPLRGTWNALGHADGRQRTGFLAIGQRLFLIRAARHVVRHRPHVHHLCHRLCRHSSRRRWHSHRCNQKAQDRKDREQTGDKGPESHGWHTSHILRRGKRRPSPFAYRNDGAATSTEPSKAAMVQANIPRKRAQMPCPRSICFARI